ncbi:hypothetical protein BKA69DRAFT_1026783 [Paraphysoderma sedebokerense]|nr:hypothetical protein BKA69DRAFT_1026783 [Paraphysoderma sedebokerense]
MSLLSCFESLFPRFNSLLPNNQKAKLNEIKAEIDSLISSISLDLRNISLQIHEHPELSYQETLASSLLSDYMESNGFKVTRHAYGLETAFVCEFISQKTVPAIGFCSEFDALKNLGHACGHNLIAISGVAAAIATRHVLQMFKLRGKVYLLGTPAEESGGGKLKMLREGAFSNLDVCMMVHPGPSNFSRAKSSYKQSISISYYGKSAHASASPWDGINALDAMCLAFSYVSAVRQQIKPTDRVHGVISNGGSAANVIPDYTAAKFTVRSATHQDLETLIHKVSHCFNAAATATGCQLEVSYGSRYSGFLPNDTLSSIYRKHMEGYGINFDGEDEDKGFFGASTDMGDVTHEVPGIHPGYYIGFPNVYNHTKQFVEASKSSIAHENTLVASKGLALTALTIIMDRTQLDKVKTEFEERKDTDDNLILLEEGDDVTIMDNKALWKDEYYTEKMDAV